MSDFFRRLLDSKDSSINSKILTVLVGLILIVTTTILVLIGVPPNESIHVGKLIYGLVFMIVSAAGIEVSNQIFNNNDDDLEPPM
jgi:ABC-type polysaccharide/polyol phosphate export permease